VDRGGFVLYFGRGARLSGYDCEHIKTCCIAAGLPVIDSRVVAFKDVVRAAVRGPIVAVGEQASPALSWTLFRAGRWWRKPVGRPAPRSSTFRIPRGRQKSERKSGQFATVLEVERKAPGRPSWRTSTWLLSRRSH